MTAFTTLAFLVHLLEEQGWIKSRSPVVGAVQIINQWIGEREIDGTINFTENAILGISSLIQTNSIYGGLDERLIFEHKPITENTHDGRQGLCQQSEVNSKTEPWTFLSTLLSKRVVGVERFELPTSCSQSRRATRLRYTPQDE